MKGRGVRGASQSLSALEAPFDDTVPLNDILITTTGQQHHQQQHRPRRRQDMFSPTAGGGTDTTNSHYVHVEGQTIPVPEPINDVSDTAPIVDSDEGRSFESDATATAVQVITSNPIRPWRANLTVAILFAINLLNYVDRYTIAGVLNSVKEYYRINDTMLGLLQTAFIVSYMTFSPIFGYLGDRYCRKYIMACGIFFWSCLTFAGSFVGRDKFGIFLFLRALVGIGEATYSTIAPTIIADLFVKDMRSRMLMVFYFAIPVGSGLGYIVGSNVAALVGNWKYALRVTPPLGVACTVLILLLLSEPKRGSSEGGTHLKKTSYVTDVKTLLKNKSFLFSTLGFTCVAFVTGALALWAPYFMYDAIRLLDGSAEMAQVSLKFGIITCAAGFTGVALGSVSAQYFRKINPRADPLICANGMLLCTPFLFFTLLTMQYSITASWVLIFIGETLLCLNWAIVADILLYVVIPTRRSLAESFQIIISHMFGDAGSPYLIGMISDKLSSTYPEYMKHTAFLQFISLRSALYITCFMCVLGSGAFFATALFVEKDKERAENLLREGSSDDEIVVFCSPPSVRYTPAYGACSQLHLRHDLKKKMPKSNGINCYVNDAFSNGECDYTREEPGSVGKSRDCENGDGGEDEGGAGDDDGSAAGSSATSLNSGDKYHDCSLDTNRVSECREMDTMQCCNDAGRRGINGDEKEKEREEEEDKMEEGDDNKENEDKAGESGKEMQDDDAEEKEGDKGEAKVAVTSQSPSSSPPPLRSSPPLLRTPSGTSSPAGSSYPARPTASPPPPPPLSSPIPLSPTRPHRPPPSPPPTC